MKYFLILTLFIWSLFALANQAFVGTWSWSAFQCRNSNLESHSARSVAWELPAEGLNPGSAKIVMESNQNASFTYCCEEEQTVRETGLWEVTDNTHVKMGDDDGGFWGYLIDGALVIYGDQNGRAIPNGNCSSSEKFVLIFNRVDQ